MQQYRSKWYRKTMELVSKYKLGFLHNPGGGQFTCSNPRINIQVSCMDDKEDYEDLYRGLVKLGLEDKPAEIQQ